MEDYTERFAKLRTDASPTRWSAVTCHRAPHKPLLLLAVMDLFAQGIITSNLIEPAADLGELFTLYWARVMPPDRRGNLALPFFPMNGDRKVIGYHSPDGRMVLRPQYFLITFIRSLEGISV